MAQRQTWYYPSPSQLPAASAPTAGIALRRWAKENDIQVSDRGRISIDLRTRDEAVH